MEHIDCEFNNFISNMGNYLMFCLSSYQKKKIHVCTSNYRPQFTLLLPFWSCLQPAGNDQVGSQEWLGMQAWSRAHWTVFLKGNVGNYWWVSFTIIPEITVIQYVFEQIYILPIIWPIASSYLHVFGINQMMLGRGMRYIRK